MSDQEHVESIADEDILRNLADGCSRCFELLFHRYSRPVYSISFRILRDRAESEDILQEVFLSIYLQQERFDPARGSVRTWILQFAYFKSLLRRRYLNVRHFYKQQKVLEGLELRSNDAPELMGLTPTEWGQYVEAGILTLGAKHRRIIELVHFEGYTRLGTSSTSESMSKPGAELPSIGPTLRASRWQAQLPG